MVRIAPGVRDVLLGPLGRDEARLVLKHCSEYVEQRFGRSGPNFPALAISQLTDGPSDAVADAAVASAARDTARAERAAVGADSQQPFAEVAARVLERSVDNQYHSGQPGKPASACIGDEEPDWITSSLSGAIMEGVLGRAETKRGLCFTLPYALLDHSLQMTVSAAHKRGPRRAHYQNPDHGFNE